MSFLDQLLFGYRVVKNNANALLGRQTVNFQGTGVSVADDPTNKETIVTINAGGGGGSITGQTNVTLANGLNSNIATAGQPTLRAGGPTAAFSIGGLAPLTSWAGGNVVWFTNTTSQVMTIVHEDTASTATNRFSLPGGLPIVVPPRSTSIQFVYDGTINRFVQGHTGFRYDHLFNVQDGGAARDGTTDDTAFIQAIINTAGKSGRCEIPTGGGSSVAVYRITAPLLISSNASQIGLRFTSASRAADGGNTPFQVKILCDFPTIASGSTATIASLTADPQSFNGLNTVMTITGLAGVGSSTAQVGDSITLSGCAHAGNNYTATILSISSTQVTALWNNYDEMNFTQLGAGTDANSGSISWVIKAPMVRCYSRGVAFENICFEGNSKCSAIIDLTWDSGGGALDSTNCHFTDCSFNNAVYGIKIGDVGTNGGVYRGNNENHEFQSCQFVNMAHSGINIPNCTGQSKNHRIDGCSFSSMPYGVWIVEGSFRMSAGGGESITKGMVQVFAATEPLEMEFLDMEDCSRVITMTSSGISSNAFHLDYHDNRVDYSNVANMASDGYVIRYNPVNGLTMMNNDFAVGHAGYEAISILVSNDNAGIGYPLAVIGSCTFGRSDSKIVTGGGGGQGAYLSLGNAFNNGTSRGVIAQGMQRAMRSDGADVTYIVPYSPVPWTMQDMALEPDRVSGFSWAIVNGANNNLSEIPNVLAVLEVTSALPSAPFTITGLVAPAVSGTVRRILNLTGQPMTVANNSGSSSAANRIFTGTGADITCKVFSCVYLKGSGLTSGWYELGNAGSVFSAAFYQTVQAGGTPMTQRPILDFVGAVLADDSGGNRTIVDVSYQTVAINGGAAATARAELDLVAGSGVTLAVTDHADRTSVSITAPGASNYQTVQGGGTPVTQRPTIDFEGPEVVDDAGNTRTQVNVHYQTVQNNGVPMTKRPVLNLLGMDTTDDSGNSSSDIIRPYEVMQAYQQGTGLITLANNTQTKLAFTGSSLTSLGFPVGVPGFVTDTYTVGQAGVYRIDFVGAFTTNTTTQVTLQVFKNGSQQGIGFGASVLTSQLLPAHCQTYVVCSAADTLDIRMIQTVGTSIQVSWLGTLWVQKVN